MALAMVAGNFIYGPLDQVFRTRKWIAVVGNCFGIAALFWLAFHPGGGIYADTALFAIIGLCGASYGLLIAHARAFVPAHLTGRGVTLMNFFSIGGVGTMQFASGAVVGPTATTQSGRACRSRLGRGSAPPPKTSSTNDDRPRIVWIGSPSTTQYLSMLAQPLARLAQDQPFVLRVIGASTLRMPGVDVEMMDWSERTESTAINTCDIGVMPLAETHWEQGKCAYKLIQYMACALPTVASPVGANFDVTLEGETGYFARTDDDWIARLGALLRDPLLRSKLGNAGRARVEECYSLQRTAPRLITLLRQAAEMPSD